MNLHANQSASWHLWLCLQQSFYGMMKIQFEARRHNGVLTHDTWVVNCDYPWWDWRFQAFRMSDVEGPRMSWSPDEREVVAGQRRIGKHSPVAKLISINPDTGRGYRHGTINDQLTTPKHVGFLPDSCWYGFWRNLREHKTRPCNLILWSQQINQGAY